MDLILLLMASRWVQDGFNIGFGCCTWLIDRCKIHRKKWYGFDIALDGFKMGSRWVQHRLWKKVSRWPQDSSSPNRPVTKTVQNQRTNCSMILTPSWAYLGPSWVNLRPESPRLLSTSAIHIVKTNIFCILLKMPSR